MVTYRGLARLNDRLRRRLLRQLVQVGQIWEQAEDLQQAANVYEEGLRVDPCAEDVCRRLMTVYYSLGRPGEIARHLPPMPRRVGGEIRELTFS